jgi:predicted ATP-grasp superfamily ATP-dependent carboligase
MTPDAGKTRVLVAGVSARAMAASAARAGYEVTSLDAFGDLDRSPNVSALSLPRDFGVPFTAAALARVSRSIECDVVTYLSPFENHPAAVQRLAAGRTLWGNDPSTLRLARDPSVLERIFGREPHTRSDDAARWLIKPRSSGGGHGIRFWQHGEAVPRRSYIQRFVDGVAGSIVFVAANGKACPLGMTRQLIGDASFGASGFRYCGNVLGAAGDPQFEQEHELFTAACRLADVAARELRLVGVNGIDFIASGGVPTPVEINPRWSASMELIEQAYGVPVFQMHANACASGSLPEFDLARHRAGAQTFAKAILFAHHDVVCEDTESWLADDTVRDIPHPGERIERGRPVCTILAQGTDAAACYTALVQRATERYATLDEWSAVTA